MEAGKSLIDEKVFLNNKISGLILICLRSDKWMCVRMLMQDYQITARINFEHLKTDRLSCRIIFNRIKTSVSIYMSSRFRWFLDKHVSIHLGAKTRFYRELRSFLCTVLLMLMLNPFPPSRLLSWLSCLNQLYLMLGFTFPEILPKT